MVYALSKFRPAELYHQRVHLPAHVLAFDGEVIDHDGEGELLTIRPVRVASVGAGGTEGTTLGPQAPLCGRPLQKSPHTPAAARQRDALPPARLSPLVPQESRHEFGGEKVSRSQARAIF